MQHYERSYATARAVFSILEVAGWITVAFGLLVAIAGFSSGGLWGVAFGHPTPLARMLALIPGLGIALGGLLSVAYTQSARATIDTAEITRDHLQLARGGATLDVGEGMRGQQSGALNEVVETYRGVDIIRKTKGLAVGKRLFATVDLARAHIDHELGPIKNDE